MESKTSEEHERAKGGRGRAGRSGGDASSGSSAEGSSSGAIAIATLVIRKQRETALILFLVARGTVISERLRLPSMVECH